MINLSMAQVHEDEEFVLKEIKRRKWKRLNPSDLNVIKIKFESIDPPDDRSWIIISNSEDEYELILEREDFEPISLQYSSLKELKTFLLKAQVFLIGLKEVRKKWK